MASITSPSFSLLFAATAALLFLSVEARFKNINPWCRTSDYRALCTKMVSGATTQEAAIVNAVQSTLHVTTKMTPKLNALGTILQFLPGVSKDSLVSTCNEAFGKAEDNLNEALTYLKTGDKHTVLDRIQTAESSFYDCTTAIKEIGGSTRLGLTSKILYKYASNCMAVATQM